jgi:hypothetical protein
MALSICVYATSSRGHAGQSEVAEKAGLIECGENARDKTGECAVWPNLTWWYAALKASIYQEK